MKKLYVIALILITASVAGCSQKNPKAPEVSTGNREQVTGTAETTVPIISGSEMEEFTGTLAEEKTDNASGTGEEDTVAMSGNVIITGGVVVSTGGTGVTAEVKDLIDKRADQPKDESKLTEEDIDLIDQIIQKIQGLGK